MKNKLFKGLSLSANPKHSIVDRFKALTGVFAGFGRKNDVSKNNSDYTVSLRAGEVLKHLFNVIRGLRLANLDPRVGARGWVDKK